MEVPHCRPGAQAPQKLVIFCKLYYNNNDVTWKKAKQYLSTLTLQAAVLHHDERREGADSFEPNEPSALDLSMNYIFTRHHDIQRQSLKPLTVA